MIIVTGASGFIGSCLIGELNTQGFDDIIAVDNSYNKSKESNLLNKRLRQRLSKQELLNQTKDFYQQIQFIFHFGARTNTLETSAAVFEELNLQYSKDLWSIASNFQIPFIYASSAATYGNGEYGYSDDHSKISQYKPLNAYGNSKHLFDLWALEQEKQPPYWCGLKFFNVFGPNEYHKGKMSSMVYQLHSQIKRKSEIKLFKSYQFDVDDGEQKRDFVYVNDITRLCLQLQSERSLSGLINVGSGKAISFNRIANILFDLHELPLQVEYIEMPETIRDKYQYLTEADLSKSLNAGITISEMGVEDSLRHYYDNYLLPNMYK